MISNWLKNYNGLFAACALANNPKFIDLSNYVVCIISSSVVPFIFALATMIFIWGVAQYIMGANEEAKREKGKQFMIWGIVALTVMVSVWGLVRILGGTFGVNFIIPKVQNTTTP